MNFHCVGRLAEYRYYDMDGVVASALGLSDENSSSTTSSQMALWRAHAQKETMSMTGKTNATPKTITFGIPCYNSADYMDHCIESILEGTGYADDVEIVIVDDGSTKDDTPRQGGRLAGALPHIIKAVHQENGGHGAAVMKAVANAGGVYFKNVDSDDWVDADAVRALLEKLRYFHRAGRAR